MSDTTTPEDRLCMFCRHECTEFRTIAGNRVCLVCIDDNIIPRFHEALEHEGRYPVTWGSTILVAEDFIDKLGLTFVQRYNRRVEEYQCEDRVYCPHVIQTGTAPLVGEISEQLLALTDEQKANLAQQQIPSETCGGFVNQRSGSMRAVTCRRCKGKVTTCCGVAIWTDVSNHVCDPQEAADPLAGRTQGRDYQTCPGCGRHYELIDGCNHMTCEYCYAQFCFLCGQPATETSGHWTRGSASGCTRWGVPGTQYSNPNFDGYDDPPTEQGAENNQHGAPVADIPTERTFDDEGLPLPFIANGENGRTQFHVWLGFFQDATRQILTNLGMDDTLEWLDNGPDVEVLIEMDGARQARFVGLHIYNDQLIPDRTIRQIEGDIHDLFLSWEHLLNHVVAEIVREIEAGPDDGVMNRQREFGENGRPLPWIETLADGTRRINFDIRRFQAAARSVLAPHDIQGATWLDEIPLDLEVVLESNAERADVRFVGLEAFTAQAELQEPLRLRLEAEIREFFARRPALLLNVTLLSMTDDDVEPLPDVPRIMILEATDMHRYDYQFRVEMSSLVRLYRQRFANSGLPAPDLSQVLGDATVDISFSGNLETRTAHHAHIEDLRFQRHATTTRARTLATREFRQNLSHNPALVAEIVQFMLQRFNVDNMVDLHRALFED